MSKKKPKSNLTFRVVGKKGEGVHLARWNPGPALRAGGFKAFDLWAAPGDGLSIVDWRAFGFDRAVTDELRKKPAEKARMKPTPAGRAAAIAAMLTDEARRIMIEGRADGAGARPALKQALDVDALLDDFLAACRRKSLAAKTLTNYETSLTAIRRWIGAETPAIVTREFLEEGAIVLIARHGEHGGRRSMQTLQTALSWAAGRDKWRGASPARDNYSNLNLAAPPARLRVGLKDELEALLTAVDDPCRLYAEFETPRADRVLWPRPSLGDGLMLMLWSAARVNDALSMTDRTVEGGRLVYRQQKTGTIVSVPIFGPLAERLPLMQRRRRAVWQGHGLPVEDAAELAISEQDGRPYWRAKAATGERYHRPFNDDWNRHRALAGVKAPSLLGEGLNRLNEQNLAFRPQDCRDTAVTRLLEAGCELAELVTYHGSSVEEIVRLTKHYIEFAPAHATSAGEKLLKMAEAKGMRV